MRYGHVNALNAALTLLQGRPVNCRDIMLFVDFNLMGYESHVMRLPYMTSIEF